MTNWWRATSYDKSGELWDIWEASTLSELMPLISRSMHLANTLPDDCVSRIVIERKEVQS